MTVRDQPAQGQGQGQAQAQLNGPVAPRGRHSGPCDEVLAARLADGMRRVQWLGASLEHLIRRLAGAPAGTPSGVQDGAGRAAPPASVGAIQVRGVRGEDPGVVG
ncbi:MAG TPA: hypothetical protein VHQ00_13655 [Chloroflexota bacterium]|nr:hypothetical protein [Chloroflexota bacterium]